MMRVILSFVLLALVCNMASAQSCACAAALEGFTIDCSDIDQLNDAFALLESNGCDTTCTSETCRVNFLIVQTHHDFCDEDALPTAIEEEFHEFEETCEQFSCDILRQFDPNQPSCPTPDCDDDDGNDAFDFLEANNCATTCTGECQTQFFILRAYHDLCPDGTLSEEAEEGLHEFEEVCQDCNVVDDDDSQTTCGDFTQDSCACDASMEGWTIDCSDLDQLNDAFTLLETNGCETSCTSEICRVNYHIVQAHHDFCDEDALPETIEEEFHEFEDACDRFSCSILRQFEPNQPSCPTPDCDDDDGNDAFDFLEANNCLTSCSGECQTQFFILRAYHDLCPDGSLDTDAEEGIHDFEEVCQDCNVVDDDDSQTVCTSSSSSNSPSSSSGSPASPRSPSSSSNSGSSSSSSNSGSSSGSSSNSGSSGSSSNSSSDAVMMGTSFVVVASMLALVL